MKKLLSHAALLTAAFFFVGCTVKASMRVPNNKFVYPNSNVTPMGRVQAKTTSTSFLIPKMFNAQAINDTIEKALAQKGGDVLLDSKIIFKVTMFPVIPIMITTLDISGTAAKMVVGKQELQ